MKDEVKTTVPTGLSEHFASSSQRTLSIDVAKYQAFLDGSGLAPEQKEEFLRAMWSIVVTFVDLGFAVQPLDEACGKDGQGGNPRAKAAFDQVDSKKPDKPQTLKEPGPSGGLEGQ